MKRDEISLGHAAIDLQLGALSDVEDELTGAPPDEKLSRELTEDLLYFHLECARRAKEALERLREWGPEYNAKYREREHALAQASKHYLRLMDASATIPPLLAAMVLAEGGLTP
jgi:hypothetical protein